jgi:hypothetical protein
MQLGHLLTRSGLTYPEVSSKVCHDSFCQLGNSVSLPWVICYEAFYLHVVSSSSCIPIIWNTIKSSCNQEISWNSYNLKAQNMLQLISVLNMMNPVYTVPSCHVRTSWFPLHYTPSSFVHMLLYQNPCMCSSCPMCDICSSNPRILSVWW